MIKMSDEEIQSVLKVVEKRLKQNQTFKEKEPKEDAPVHPTKTQYPLKGFPFHIEPIIYEANFEELSIYSPLSIMEVDDWHKRRRKKLDYKFLFMALDLDVWEALKEETERTPNGYTSRTIKKIMDENAELRKENKELHRLVVELVKNSSLVKKEREKCF